jgi:hypothetical protein
MTTYYLQNQMITKLSEQSTMEEQINLSPQKKYTPSGSEYFQESVSLASGTLTTFPYLRRSDFDYMILENTGTTSVVVTSFALGGSVSDVQIASSASGELKAGTTSMNRTNYAYKIAFATADENDIRNLLTPISFSQGVEFPSQPLMFQFTESGGTLRGPFFLIEAQISANAWQFDMFASTNLTLNAATGYKLDVYLPQAQVVPSGASIVIPGGDLMQAVGTTYGYSLGAAGFPHTSGTTSPGGEIKLTGVQA